MLEVISTISFGTLVRACSKGKIHLVPRIQGFMAGIRYAQKISEKTTGRRGGRKKRFILSTYLLNLIHSTLCRQDEESVLYATGIKERNTYIPLSIVMPKHQHQSFASAIVDPHSTYEILSLFSRFGHSLMLQCHLHNGSGPLSVHPSSTDLRTHQGLVHNYPALDLIFARDGTFSINRRRDDWIVRFYGKGVKRVGPNIYTIDTSA